MLLVFAVALAGVTQCSARSARRSSVSLSSTSTTSTTAPTSRPPARPCASRYREQPVATLAHAVEDPATGAIGATVVFAGGLDSASTSTARVGSIRDGSVHTLPDLPSAFHDAAGAVVEGQLFVFGGGDGYRQLDGITRIDADGAVSAAGTLPAPSSDAAAATINGTAYVVGGYTGSVWLDTIVAFSPAAGAHVVAHLPTGLRYAAVGAAAGKLLVVGGTTPSSEATTAVYAFDPTTNAVTKIGDLAQPVTHASAVGIGRDVVVAGGKNAAGDPQATIERIAPGTGQIRDAGALASPRSDAGMAAVGGRPVLVGGRGTNGAIDQVSELVPSDDAQTKNVYAHDGANALSAEASRARPLVYVPNSESDTVDVIDPATYKVVDHFAVGALPQHVTPSWDLETLYVDNDRGNSLTPIDPRTGKVKGPDMPVVDPYNLYFTTDGRYAIVVAEAYQRLDFRDPHTMALVKSLPVPCRGVDHMDFTANGRVRARELRVLGPDGRRRPAAAGSCNASSISPTTAAAPRRRT